MGLAAVIDLTNELAVEAPVDAAAVARRVLAIDPPTIARLTDRDVPALMSLAHQLYPICERLHGGDVDGAASLINELLARYSAHPHLASEDGRWRIHHHPVDADVVAMWTAIAADAFARLVGNGHHERIGICRAPGCGRVFHD
ncbi:MAG: ABATE domain-containing protein, partial [Ilumatobacteraceae bacterium]